MPSATWLTRSYWDALSPIRQLERASSSYSGRAHGANTSSSTTAPRGYPPPRSATPCDSPAPAEPSVPIRRPVGTARSHERPSASNARPSALNAGGDLPSRPPPLSHPGRPVTRQPAPVCSRQVRYEGERYRAPRSDGAAASEDRRAGVRARREDDRIARSATRNEPVHAHAQRDAPPTRAGSPHPYEQARTRAHRSEREIQPAARTAPARSPGGPTGASATRRGMEPVRVRDGTVSVSNHVRPLAGLSSPPRPPARLPRLLPMDTLALATRSYRSPAPPSSLDASSSRHPPARALSPCSQGRADVHAYFAAQGQVFEQHRRARALAQQDDSPARPFTLDEPTSEHPSADCTLSPRSRARAEVRAHHERKDRAAEAAWRAHQERWSPDRWPSAPVPPAPAPSRAHRTSIPPGDAPQPTRDPRADAPTSRGPAGPTSAAHPRHSSDTRAPVVHAHHALEGPTDAQAVRVRDAAHSTEYTPASPQTAPARSSGGPVCASSTRREAGATGIRDGTDAVSTRPAHRLPSHGSSVPAERARRPPSTTREKSVSGDLREGCRAERDQRALGSLSSSATSARKGKQARVYAPPSTRPAPPRLADQRLQSTRTLPQSTPITLRRSRARARALPRSRFRTACKLLRPTDTRAHAHSLRSIAGTSDPSALLTVGRPQPMQHARIAAPAPSVKLLNLQNRPNGNATPRERWPAPVRTGQEFEASLRSVQASTSIHPSSALPVAGTNRHDGLRGRHSPPSPSMPGTLDACPPSACSPSVSTDMRRSAPSQAISLPADTESSGLPPQRENLARFWSSFLRKPQALASV
ncbi:uncharacterized protein C8Q71DRAFT_859849 [Rhodofomes roseus]|uniref:Uncharacterized protein n=1 Tax=Rhodofomes roseus TaxID=34475 RepID=A0ABQ8KA11_9APHY|nr:uncharacterized protein C8Q71DRAFT_859849 [Rhodofomes roseus]KAH9834198.1 hypothetical protein C8Q71DRAFT_859849 [Rhodofomes roseus]